MKDARRTNVYILGAGFSAYANMPLIGNFLERMREVREFSDDLSDSAKEAIDDALQERASVSSVREKIRIDLDNIEELFSLIEATGNVRSPSDLNKLQRSTRKAISATLLASYKPGTPVPRYGRSDAAMSVLRRLGRQTDSPIFGSFEIDPHGLFAGLLLNRLDSVRPEREVLISFNYDLVLETAFRLFDVNIDYCLPNAKYDQSVQPSEGAIQLAKLHGFINWSSPISASDPINVVDNPSRLIEGEGFPLLLPPTWNKGSLMNTIEAVWSKATEALKSASRIVMIGYSMPSGDAHFKYLLSAGLRENRSLRSFVIINPADLSERFEEYFDNIYFNRRLRLRKEAFEDFMRQSNVTIREYLGKGELLT
jgi:hypothetical protein